MNSSTAIRNTLAVATLLFSHALLVRPAMAETVLITGANSGIGLEFARQYAARGWTVIATHRRSETPPTLAALDEQFETVQIERVDVTSIEAVNALATKLASTPIDVLINNAGVYNDRGTCSAEDEACPGDWTTQDFGNLRFQLFDTIMAVNVKGPLLVSEALADNVKASEHKKIVAISSSNGSLTGGQGRPSGGTFYRTSKAALNRAMQLVAGSLKDDGVTVLLLNPGPTLTERQMHLKEFSVFMPVEVVVENMINTIDTVTIDQTGAFLRYDGEAEPW